jgi:predicted nucleotidyltransferase
MVYIQLEKTDFEVLGFLVGRIGEEYSIKELAEKLKRPYVKVHSSIKRLSGKKIIKEAVKGKSHYCSFDYKENLGIACFVSSQKAREFLEKNKQIKIIIEEIDSHMKYPDYSLALFGSYAKGNAGNHSDIDLAILSSSEGKEEAERVINSIRRIYPQKIHSLEFTYKDFIEMLKAKEGNVGKEIIKNSIIFKGYEQFYQCRSIAE